jgi:ATP-dependent Lhr-like helicase
MISKKLSGIQQVERWFKYQKWAPAEFQRELWREFGDGKNGLLVAPTGSGKTYAVWGGVVSDALERGVLGGGLRALWITPLRALATDIASALTVMNVAIGLDWEVQLRTGDTSSSVKKRQREQLPEVLVTTPESLHVMLSYPGASKLFAQLEVIVADEWHELMGSKRGVMLELAVAHIGHLSPSLRVWGVSATIGNLDEARDVLLASQSRPNVVIRDPRPKLLEAIIEIPEDMERFPWSGHLGERMTRRVLEIIQAGGSTLVFTNTRAQAEIWYQRVLMADPNLAGRLAIHHGSLSMSERTWVETALHEGRLAAVIATSSLDLGLDFRPVDTVVQIGGPKGVARFMQRAGRSGHQPGATSRIHFIPTNALELIEAAALRESMARGETEAKPAVRQPFDLLSQWLVTLACGDGFFPDEMYREVAASFSYQGLERESWDWIIQFLIQGGILNHYPQYQKLVVNETGRLVARDKDIIRRHRMNIGAIISSVALKVQFLSGKVIGSVEESFLTALKPGQTFWFAGRSLEYVRLRGLVIYVRPALAKKGPTPRWNGGRLPLSSNLAAELRRQVGHLHDGDAPKDIATALGPIIAIQQDWSAIPRPDELLVEAVQSREGSHFFFFPFEGRAVHEVLGAVLATRLGGSSWSLAMNDNGFELLNADPIELDASEVTELFRPEGLATDLDQALADGTMAKRQFRGIAEIAGLITTGYPGKAVSGRHLQASSEMVFEVLAQYDPTNKLLEQAREEVLAQVYNIERLKATMVRLYASTIVLTAPPKFTPLAFGIMVDRLRERIGGEALDERLARLVADEEHYADAA